MVLLLHVFIIVVKFVFGIPLEDITQLAEVSVDYFWVFYSPPKSIIIFMKQNNES